MTTAAAESFVELRLRSGDIQLSSGRTAFISGPTGQVTRDPRHGLFVYQTRLLGKYHWVMNGKEPEFSCGSNIEQHSWMAYYIQAPTNWKETPANEASPLQETIELRLKRFVGEGMHEDVLLTNHTQIKTEVQLELQFQPEFLAPEEAKGKRKQRGKMSKRWREVRSGAWELQIGYFAKHHYQNQEGSGNAEFQRGLTLRIENADSPPQYQKSKLRFSVALQPHATWKCCIEWLVSVQGELLPAPSPHHRPTEYERKRSKYLSNITGFTVAGNDLRQVVARTARRAAHDLCSLQMFDLEEDDDVTVAAGVPTYMGVFGRDMMASAWQAALLGPQLAIGSLRILKEHQAKEMDDWRDAEPGRIVHEMHTDPLSVLNFRPKARYYGSASGAFLYPILLCELWHWTGDLELIGPFVDAAVRAVKSADEHSLDETGFYRYQTKSDQGMKNQGWKDSSDAIVYPDGTQVSTPIGTCEMQAFAYAAKRQLAEVLWWTGQVTEAASLWEQASALKQRFNDRFWMEDEGTFAMAIDDHGELVRSVASDPGHCLLSGIVDEGRVPRLANRLLMKDLFSGWGIRTLSADHPAYNPFSYHRGSVWPVENGAFVLGFARYGLHGEMWTLARALFETAQLFPYCRLPETLAGHQRSADAPFPGLYTKADWPQAWSASAVINILRALLGLFPYAAANVLFLDPHLPDWLPEITIENLTVGKARVTIHFERKADGSSDYKVLDIEGKLHVLRQPSPWSLSAEWPQRVKEALSSLVHGH
ncbi:MAG TPA: glycogen debranching N-terminal domain-containing protein [Terriglobales bacterium]|nr:glycogen debranching N-terminal domain-containing protein [Terriglobales bacterium]